MDLIENDLASSRVLEESFRIVQDPPDSREFAIVILDSGDSPTERGFSDSADTGNPDDGAFFPKTGQETFPEFSSDNHDKQIITEKNPNANTITFGRYKRNIKCDRSGYSRSLFIPFENKEVVLLVVANVEPPAFAGFNPEMAEEPFGVDRHAAALR